MSFQTLEPAIQAARRLPPGWIDGGPAPLAALDSLRHAPDWAGTPQDVRESLISQAGDCQESDVLLGALYLLSTWEPLPELRAEIAGEIWASGRAGRAKLLGKISRNEPPDEGGKIVRERIEKELRSSEAEGGGRRERGAVQTSGGAPEIRLRAAVRTRGSVRKPAESDEAAAVLRELAALRAANPWF